MASPKQLTKVWWLFLLPLPALWCAANFAHWLDFLEHRLLDWRFRARGELQAPITVAYVDMDSESITDLGEDPWDRGYFAEVADALLTAGGVRAVGIDLVFSLKGQPELLDAARFEAGNRRLAQLLFDGPPIVLAAGYAAAEDRDINGNRIVRKLPRAGDPEAEAHPPELPEFRAGPDTVLNPPHVGLIDTHEGGTRRVPLFARAGGRTYYHLAVQLARLYWGLPETQIQISDTHLEIKARDGAVRARVPLTDGQTVEVNWFSRWSSPEHNPRASFVEALVYARHLGSADPGEQAAARAFFEQFRGSVVLIGPVDPLLQDIAPTPLDPQPVPRVGIHGNLLKTLVSGLYLQRLSPGAEAGVIFLLTTVVCALAVGFGRSTRRGWLRLGSVLVLGAYAALCFWVFSRWHWVLPMAAPLGAAFTTSFAAVGWQLAREEKQKGRIKSMFGTYVSPQLVNRMVESGEDPKLGGAEVEITAYFSDIQDFSSFSEKMTPPQVVELMNEYLTACTDLITAEGGTLDKYIGDAVVAMFGAPVALSDHAYRACQSAIAVQQRLVELRRAWSAEADRWPPSVGRMRMRIGLNTGAAVVGNMGSLTRFNYTMMGDAVNLAARLESAAKVYGAGTLVTEMTRRACELHGTSFLFRYIDRLVVKGRTQPVDLYELLGRKADVRPETRQCVEVFEEAMALYLKREWGAARRGFARAAELEPGQADFPGEPTASSVYVERCDQLLAQPPGPEWDGVWRLSSK